MTYDSRVSLDFDDRVLAHLQIVIFAKLRRHEPFSFTNIVPAHFGSGRSSLWVSSDVSLTFQYFGTHHSINPQWIDALIRSANSPGGLRLLDEPAGA